MGNKHQEKYISEQKSIIQSTPADVTSLKKYNKIGVIGRGGFGKVFFHSIQVWKVELKKDKKMYALKEMSKARVLFKRSVESVMNELQLLKCLKDDFLINALFAFQDRQNLYLIMDLVTGGDLRFHLIKNMKFNEEQTSTFVVIQNFLPAVLSQHLSFCTIRESSIAT